MNQRTPNDLLDAFVADGNKLIGHRPKSYIGTFDLVWYGAGSLIELGENVTFSLTRLIFGYGGGTVRIGNDVVTRGKLEVNSGGEICIGSGTRFNRVSDIRGGEGAKVEIGEKCLFSNVKVMTSDMHSILNATTGERTNPAAGITIEDNVWLAEDVKIAKGVRVGSGSVVAAGSLVTHSIAPLSLAAGRPARVLRSGISWSRSLKNVPHLPAPQFTPAEIPLEKETIRHLIHRKEYGLVEAVISSAEKNGHLPIFARWYLVLSRHQLGIANPNALGILDSIISEAPEHTAALNLRKKLQR